MKNAQSKGGKKWLGSMALATAVLGGFILFSGASNARAADWDDYGYYSPYDRQVQYTEWRAHEAAERFGYHSREAKYWRHENHEARERAEHFRHEQRERRERHYRDSYDRP
jgi:hypothetical protein